MTTEEAVFRITHHIRVGLPFTANQPEVERGEFWEDQVIDTVSLRLCQDDMRRLLQLYIAHAPSRDIHEAVQGLFMLAINRVAEDYSKKGTP